MSMKKFTEWLKDKNLLEASPSGKMRASSGDLTNISIGALGPYKTFGHSDKPGVFQTAAASAVGGIGDSIRKELGPMEAPARLLDPDLSIFKKDNMVQDEMILQLPIAAEGEDLGLPERWNPISAWNKRLTFRNVQQVVPDPLQDQRIFNIGDTSSFGKFLPYTEETEKQEAIFKMSFYQAAVEFTTALSKIRLYNMLDQKTSDNIKDVIDLENPTLLKQQVLNFGNYYKLISLFKYERKKTASGDADVDFT